MPIPYLDDENHVILSSIDETVIQHGAEFNLGIHKYEGDNYNPKGHKYIREFNCDGVPKTIYRVGGVILSKESNVSSKENRLMIRYRLLDAHSPTIIRFRPFLAFRNASQLTQENDHVDRSYREVENGISTCMYFGYPELFIQFTKKPEFMYFPDWYKGIEYLQDQQNGDNVQRRFIRTRIISKCPLKRVKKLSYQPATYWSTPQNLPRNLITKCKSEHPVPAFIIASRTRATNFIIYLRTTNNIC